jgi:hypothetical protein
MTARLTKHQKETLAYLARLSATAREGWVDAKVSGAPAALEHLYRKGYVEREIRIGPRGGEHPYYRVPREERDRIVVSAARNQLPVEIDSRLIRARRESRPVMIYCGPNHLGIRGIPGEVMRDDDDGHVKLVVGQRKLPLVSITRVEWAEVAS